MTLAELEALDQEFLVPAQVAGVLGCSPFTINVQAQQDPSKLGFPVCVMGSRVKIPKQGFIHWFKYGNAPAGAERKENT